jgi:hypothetical protein
VGTGSDDVAERKQVDDDREAVHPALRLDADPPAGVEAKPKDWSQPADDDPDPGQCRTVAERERERDPAEARPSPRLAAPAMASPIDAPTATRSNRPRRAVKAHDQTSPNAVTGARLDRDARAAIGMDPHWHRGFSDRPPALGELTRDGFIEPSRSLSYRSQDQ